MKQLRLDGSLDLGRVVAKDPHRTKAGDLKASVRDAFAWYLVEHALKVTAASAYPVMIFLDRDGQEVPVNISDIVAEYKEFKRTTHGKRQQAA